MGLRVWNGLVWVDGLCEDKLKSPFKVGDGVYLWCWEGCVCVDVFMLVVGLDVLVDFLGGKSWVAVVTEAYWYMVYVEKNEGKFSWRH